ncbi:glycosyltransferase family 2 protein [Pseudomonadota bacterium]
MPEISIITPSLNASKVIADCIRSVAEQTGKPQHLVIDGNSTDATLDVIRAAGAGVEIIQQAPAGIYPAINAGIEASGGEIIGILHADDFYASADVLQQVSAAFENPSVDACYGDLCYVDCHQPSKIVRYWRAGEYRPGRLRHGWMPPHPTFFVRHNVYEQFGCYRTDLGTAADYELMLRFLLKHGITAVYLPQVLVHMRAGGASNASWQARLAANRMDRRAWKVNDLKPLPWTTMAKPLRKLGQWWSRP